MSDHIEILHGHEPWKPTPETESVHVFDEYDMPLQGVLRQHGCPYLFECLVGRTGTFAIWLYNLLRQEQVDALATAEGAEFRKMTRDFQRNRPATIAVAVDDAIVVTQEVTDMPDGLPDAVRSVGESFRQYLDRVNRGDEELRDLEASGAWDRMVEAS